MLDAAYAAGVRYVDAARSYGLAERFLAHRYNKPGYEIVNHWTYTIASDGDIMEGVAHEASAIAGIPLIATGGVGSLADIRAAVRELNTAIANFQFSSDQTGAVDSPLQMPQGGPPGSPRRPCL